MAGAGAMLWLSTDRRRRILPVVIIYNLTPLNTQIYIYIYIQGVTGGTDQTSGGCSLC